jgi:hypothetical protein
VVDQKAASEKKGKEKNVSHRNNESQNQTGSNLVKLGQGNSLLCFDRCSKRIVSNIFSNHGNQKCIHPLVLSPVWMIAMGLLEGSVPIRYLDMRIQKTSSHCHI